MKTLKKFLSVILAAAVALGAAPVLTADAAELEIQPISYTESTEYDLGSCDSGYTSTQWIRAEPGKDWSTTVSRYFLLLIGIGGYSSAMNDSGTDYDFDQAFFASLENTLKSARENGATVGLRFRYDDNGAENPEPADFTQVLRHVEQIGESGLFTEYEDVISFIETGFVGCWGEQWGGKYTSTAHKAELLQALMDITPVSIPLTVRTPNIFREWLKTYCGVETSAQDMSYTLSDPELSAQAARVGLYNDGYMGSDTDLGTYQNRAGETAWLSNAPAYGGEFSGNDGWRLKYSTWLPENALPEMYLTQLTRINSNIWRTHTDKKDFSTQTEAEAKLQEIDALYESAGLGDYDYSGTVTQNDDGTYRASWKWMGYDDFTFDEALDSKLGVSCDNSAFYGENVWQFIRAHLGYRFVLRKSALTAESVPGGNLEMKFSVENTGFSDTPKAKEAEIILTDGKASFTYSSDIDPHTWASGTTSEEKLSLTLPETLHGGEWEVYLRISEKNEDSALDCLFDTKFANTDLRYSEELGANYMGTFTVNGESDPDKTENEDSRMAGFYPEGKTVSITDDDKAELLSAPYTFTEDGHYGYTFFYRIDGLTEPIRLGNLYSSFTVNDKGYSSAYTTYGLNTMNLELTEDGYYAWFIPFYGCAFNCTESTAGNSQITAFNINDSRNYWSEDTYTVLGGNTDVKITPIAFIEGAASGYSVTFCLESGDYTYTGEYGFEDKLTQSIRNKPSQTALSLLDKPYEETVTRNGNTYRFLGFTTKEGDKSSIIDENFPAAGELYLYPYYELDKSATDLSSLTYELINGCDSQGVRYVLDESTMTASVGDGSYWENNSGYSESGSIIIPGYVSANGKCYRVTEISGNAFGSNTAVLDVTVSRNVTKIGENPFYIGTEIITYRGTAAAELASLGYSVTLIEDSAVMGDADGNGEVTLLDAVALKKHIVNVKSLDREALYRCDMDNNGRINVLDLIIFKSLLNKY